MSESSEIIYLTHDSDANQKNLFPLMLRGGLFACCGVARCGATFIGRIPKYLRNEAAFHDVVRSDLRQQREVPAGGAPGEHRLMPELDRLRTDSRRSSRGGRGGWRGGGGGQRGWHARSDSNNPRR